MTRDLDGTADFERQVHALLEEGVQRVGGRARSRLNQARHAALAESIRSRRWYRPWRPAAWAGRGVPWMPAAGAIAAAVLVAFTLWPHSSQIYPAAEVNHATVEDLDLLADRDGMELMQGGDGQFYQWAMAQAQSDSDSATSGPDASDPGERHGQGANPQGSPNSGQNSG